MNLFSNLTAGGELLSEARLEEAIERFLKKTEKNDRDDASRHVLERIADEFRREIARAERRAVR